MPCSDHQGPWEEEEKLKLGRANAVRSFLTELDSKGRTICYHFSQKDHDIDCARLCAMLRDRTPEEISKFSLELQIWWRDHKRADIARIEREQLDQKNAEIRRKALQKLTAEEKRILKLI